MEQQPQSWQIEINRGGYLQLSAEIAERFFAEDALVPVVKEKELWLLPLRRAQGGGLLLKHRNSHGDRSVLLLEFVPEKFLGKTFAAFWDEANAALRVGLI